MFSGNDRNWRACRRPGWRSGGGRVHVLAGASVRAASAVRKSGIQAAIGWQMLICATAVWAGMRGGGGEARPGFGLAVAVPVAVDLDVAAGQAGQGAVAARGDRRDGPAGSGRPGPGGGDDRAPGGGERYLTGLDGLAACLPYRPGQLSPRRRGVSGWRWRVALARRAPPGGPSCGLRFLVN